MYLCHFSNSNQCLPNCPDILLWQICSGDKLQLVELERRPRKKKKQQWEKYQKKNLFLTGGETGMKMENLNRDRFLLWRFSSSFLARFSSRFFPNCAYVCVLTLKNIRDPKPNGHIFSFLTPPTFFSFSDTVCRPQKCRSNEWCILCVEQISKANFVSAIQSFGSIQLTYRQK